MFKDMRSYGDIYGFEVQNDVQLRYFESKSPEQILGTVIILPGRASYLEKYEEIIHFWISNRYQVFALEWRGQGLSTRMSSKDRHVHIEDYSTYVDDLEKWLNQIVLPRSHPPRVFYAVSMGALIAGLFLQKDSFARIDQCLMIVPMFGFFTSPFPIGLVKLLTQLLCRIGLSKLPVPSRKYNPIEDKGSSDPIPTGLTLGWLNASLKAIRHFSRSHHLLRIRVPLFVALAENDTDIDNSMTLKICDQISNGTVKMYDKAPHGIHHANPELRTRLLQDCLSFLSENSQLNHSVKS